MPQTPSGLMSLPLSHLRRLVSECEAFQTWTGAADATEALEHIHLVELPQGDLVRPFALIGFGARWKTEQRSVQLYTKTGELFLMFEADVADADQASAADAIFGFMNPLGDVVSEMLEKAGTDDYLNVIELEMEEPPLRENEEDAQLNEDYYNAIFNVVWSGF